MAEQNGKVSLSDLSIGVISIELVAPNGKRIPLEMRPLRGWELRDIGRSLGDVPEAPVSDYDRRPDGTMVVIRNEQDAGYLEAMSARDERRGFLMIFRSLQNVDVPGETDDDRIHAFRELVDNWAELQLVEHVSRINGFGTRAMEVARDELTPFVEEPSPSVAD